MQSKQGHAWKVVMVGDSYVGKTSILKTYCDASHQSISGTGHVEIKVIRNGRSIRLSIYDTGGQDRFRSMTNSYYRDAKGCIVCFDVRKSESFYSLDRWLQDLQDYACDNIACVLVATRCDSSYRAREISEEDALAFAHKREIPLVEMSSLDKSSVERIFKLLIDLMINRNLTAEDQNEITDSIRLGPRNQENDSKCSCL